MLKIINDLAPFLNDCYRRLNVREYAKLLKISPPTASKVLESYFKESILSRENFKNYIFYHANIESRDFIDVSRIYWRHELDGLLEYLERNLANPSIVLFGSLSKAEAMPESDIDLAVFSGRKELKISQFESKLRRRIQIIWLDWLGSLKNVVLAKNIVNGYILKGRIII